MGEGRRPVRGEMRGRGERTRGWIEEFILPPKGVLTGR